MCKNEQKPETCYEKREFRSHTHVNQELRSSSGHKPNWWGGMRCRFAMNSMLHKQHHIA